MVFSVVGVVAAAVGWPFSSLSVIVEVEGERANGLRVPRWVSLSSITRSEMFVATPHQDVAEREAW